MEEAVLVGSKCLVKSVEYGIVNCLVNSVQ